MKVLIGDITSRLRNQLKIVRIDSFVPDRMLYSLFKKHAALSIKRLDEKKKLTAFASIFETLDYVQLVEVDKVEASACGVAPRAYSTIRKTCLPMPVFTEGVYGPMIRSITSVDGDTILKLTTPDEYNYISKSGNFKFNKQNYAWYINDHLYFPDISWPAVRIDAMVDGDISAFKCHDKMRCKSRQDHTINIPEYLFSEIESLVLKDLQFMLAVPEDDNHDNKNQMR